MNTPAAGVSRIRGEAILLLLVVLAILGFGAWWLYSSRKSDEAHARAFALEMAHRLAVNYDRKLLDIRLGPEARLRNIPSWRDRFVEQLRELGVPAQPIEVTGKVEFTSYIFDPRGSFHASLSYPTRSAYMDMTVSHGMAMWQIDAINLVWYPERKPEAVANPTPQAIK